MVKGFLYDKRGASEMMMGKLINIILLVLVILLVVALTLYWFFPNVLDDLIPDFMVDEGNETIDEDLCTKVAFIDKDDYFYIKGVKSNLYRTNGNEIMYYGSYFNRIQVGIIEAEGEERQVIIFDKYLQGDVSEFDGIDGIDEDKLPSHEILEKFSKSFKLGESNWLCEGERICEEKCEFFGVCSEKVDANKVYIGRMDCENGFCLVEKSEEVLEDDGLKINEFGFVNFDGGVDDLIGKNDLELTYGVESAKLIKFDIEGDDVCYVIRTNKRYLDKGSDDFDVVGWVAESDDETLELSAWSLDGKRVVKRLEIKSKKLPEGFDDGEVIRDKFFSRDIQGVGVGERAYVFGVDIDMYDKEKKIGIAPSDYMIKKIEGNEVEIFLYGESGGFNVVDWKKLDCDKRLRNLLGFGGVNLNLDRLKGEDYSLKKVLYEFCGLS